jgi:hypothetical protein
MHGRFFGTDVGGEEGELAAKDTESATAGKPDDPAQSRQSTTTRRSGRIRRIREPRRRTTNLGQKAPRRSSPLAWRLSDLKGSTARRRSVL